jgi:hypothetical protein
MRTPVVFPLALAAAAAAFAAPAALAQTTGAKLQAFASNVLKGMICTQYSYESEHASSAPGGAPCVFESSPGVWTSVTDCSGWVSFAIGNMMGAGHSGGTSAADQTCPAITANLAKFCKGTALPPDRNAWLLRASVYKGAFPSENGINWPRAFVYTALASDILYAPPTDPQRASFAREAAAAFEPVVDLRTLQAGDVISWCRAGWCNGNPGPGDTGHVMIVDAPPATAQTSYQCKGLPELPAKSPPEATVIGIPVIDSSGPHFAYVEAAGDKPVYPSGRGYGGNVSGLGAGCIAVAVDKTGLPFAHAMCAPDQPCWDQSQPGPVWTSTLNVSTPISTVGAQEIDYTTALRLK